MQVFISPRQLVRMALVKLHQVDQHLACVVQFHRKSARLTDVVGRLDGRSVGRTVGWLVGWLGLKKFVQKSKSR